MTDKNPTTGILAMSSTGVTFTEDQKKVIERLSDNAPTAIKPISPWVMAQTLIEVMQVVAEPPRYLRLAKALIQIGATPEDLLTWYGEGGRWWEEDWRGQQGQYPGEPAIRETARRYLHSEPVKARRNNIAAGVEAAIARMSDEQ